jgi:D-tyrosyl-tRNA(Tyr) deacylase
MRVVIQRVASARVTVDGEAVGSIGRGLLALLGIHVDDDVADADWLVDKMVDLRIFQNADGKFDQSLLEAGGELLVVSQFTLLANTGKGRRPSFTDAARPEQAIPLYERFTARARTHGIATSTGRFGASMQVALVNDGPVTILLDSRDR